MEDKRSTSYRLSEEARRLLALMAQQWGISQTSVIEIALRDIARRERILADTSTPQEECS
jgi:hypothetical protein